jgi:hypothetical protein
MTNQEFFERYAGDGMVGLIGGTHFIDEAIKKAQRNITKDKKKSPFSHTFIIGEKRKDGKRWIIESDLEFHRKQMKIGVQENRIDKYFNEKTFPNVAVLDFKMSREHTDLILKESLELVANRATYSLREVLGILVSFGNDAKRKMENKFSHENAFVCSTFVQHVYAKAGIHFSSQVSLQNMTPDDIYTTAIPCVREIHIREK